MNSVTVQDIADDVCDIVGIPHETGFTGSNSQDMRQLKTFINLEGQELARRADWSRMIREFVFNGNSTDSEFPLPSEYQRMILGGALTLQQPPFKPLIGGLDDDEWKFLLSAGQTSQIFFRFANGKIQFSKPLPIGQNVLMQYISRHWLENKVQTTGQTILKERITNDDDMPLFSSRLLTAATVVRWKREKSQDYSDHLAQMEAMFINDYFADRGHRIPAMSSK